MTLRSRLMVGFLTTLMLLVMASSSFAQISLQVIQEPSAGEIQTNRNAQTAATGSPGAGLLISGQLLTTSPLTATTLRITYPSPITSSPVTGVAGVATDAPSIPTGDFIRIEGASGVFAGTVTNGSVVLNTENSRIEILLPGSLTPVSTGGSFTLVGVRIDANGKTGAQSVTAALNQVANNYVISTPTATIINAIGPGIGTMALGIRPGSVSQAPCLTCGTNNSTATIFTNRSLADANASFFLTEGFSTAWRNTFQSSNSNTPVANGSNIRLTFNGIPAGVTLALAMGGGTSTQTNHPLFLNGVAGLGTSVTASAPTVTLAFGQTSATSTTGAPSLTSTDSIEVQVTVTVAATAAVTTPGAITVTATLVPIGDGVNNDNSLKLGLPRQDQGYPTFAQADVGPLTVVNIVPASTTMLIPLAEKVSVFDTGISVANTTADPFGVAGGGAVAQPGTLRFDFYPTTAGAAGTACFLQTSATTKPGAGISTDGSIAAGATYTVLLSQLLAASNCAAGDFVGYVFITANFLNGHGQATISDFRSYSLAANVLTLPPPATRPRTDLGARNNVESLGF